MALGAVLEIPGYIIAEEIGSGGMASVYRAVQSSLNRPVALKIMRDRLALTADYTRRFLREARAVAQLQHRHIVSIYQVGVSEDRHFYSMQLLQGGDLAARIKDRSLDWPTLRIVLMGVCEALQYSHDKGFVHRDVKPGNILFDDAGHPYLTDFGLVRDLNTTSALTAAGLSLGTSLYMSPEQITGKSVSHKCDLYGLGVTVFEAVFGRTPFTGDTSLAIAYQHVNEPVPSLTSADQPWREFFARALAKSPDDRFESAVEMAIALRELPVEPPLLETETADTDASVTVSGADTLADADDSDATLMMRTPASGEQTISSGQTELGAVDAGEQAVDDKTEIMAAYTPPEGLPTAAAVEAAPEQAASDGAGDGAGDRVGDRVGEAVDDRARVVTKKRSAVPDPVTPAPAKNAGSAAALPARWLARLQELPREQQLIWGGGLASLLALILIAWLVTGDEPAQPAAPIPVVDRASGPSETGDRAAAVVAVDRETASVDAPQTVVTDEDPGVATLDLTGDEQVLTLPTLSDFEGHARDEAQGEAGDQSDLAALDAEELVALEQQDPLSSDDAAAAALSAEVTETMSAEHGRLIGEATQHIANNQLMSPAGGNAYDKLKQVLTEDPNNQLALASMDRIVERYLQLAKASQARGNFEQAELFLQRAQRVGGEHPELAATLESFSEERSNAGIQALLRRGNEFVANGKREEAIAMFNQILAIDPNHVSARDGLSRATQLAKPRVSRFSDRLADGGRGPMLTVLEPGSYSVQWSAGRAATVQLNQRLALASHEITVEEFQRFANATGYQPSGRDGRNCKAGGSRSRRHNWSNPGFAQEPAAPVGCVDWQSANAYVQWLSQQTGKNYRLPSETEWLIAAAGLASLNLSPSEICRYGNVGDQSHRQVESRIPVYSCNDGNGHATPAGTSFRPIEPGFFGLVGGMSEWTADCWNSRPRAPASTAAVSRGNCKKRVIRGISWRSGTKHDPMDYRVNESVSDARDFIGFRVVRAY